ncbi:MAG: MATE family efflux transporter [Clostridiales bacterium]|nr:MATE family efflux transporter [Clostridiales bacterium]MBS5878157.1 MATE family efflux transporter [Clostridiales bacterium]
MGELKKDAINLSDDFDLKRLVRFVMPSVIMMVFSSVYVVIDGFFVSNFVGKTAFASVNIIMPFIMILSTIGYMFGTGGSALVSMLMGQGNEKKANEVFSMLTYILIGVGVSASILGFIFVKPIAVMLGASPDMLPMCIRYTRISMISLTCFMLQNFFQSFLVTAEKPKIGLLVMILAGVNNITFDGIFVGALGMGIEGAAYATVMSEYIAGLIPLFYFLRKNTSRLSLGRARFEGKTLAKVCGNGLSEFVTNISLSVVNIVYNIQLMKFTGPDGVSAYGAIEYVSAIFMGVFMGYSIGASPVIGYKYGAEDKRALRSVFRKSIVIMIVLGITLFALAQIFAPAIADIFVGYDHNLKKLTVYAFRIYAFAYLTLGINIFGSAFFTALNNGAVSAGLSLTRTLVFELIFVYVLPLFLGVNGIWLSIIASEVGAMAVTVVCLMHYRKRYGYGQMLYDTAANKHNIGAGTGKER